MGTTRRLAAAFSVWLVFVASPVRADDEVTQADEVERKERFAALTRHVPEYVFTTAGTEKPFELLPEPVLRWTNPVRDTRDGGVFLWTDRGRAAAIMCAFWRNDVEYKHEFQSLAEEPFEATLEGRAVWVPETGGVTGISRTKPAVAGSRALRLAQMRRIVGEYRAYVTGKGSTEELRWLRQPLHRYGDKIEARGVLDGALFAFVQTTDPEVLVLVEARGGGEGKGEPRWTVAFARMSRWKQSVLREDETAWSCEWTPGTSAKEPYVVLTYAGDTAK